MPGLFSLVVVSLFFFLFSLSTSSTSSTSASSPLLCNPVGPRLQWQCPGRAADETNCISAGCCWIPAGENSAVPWCFRTNGGKSDYEVVDASSPSFPGEKFSVPLVASSPSSSSSSSSSYSSSLFSASLRQIAATQPELGVDEGELEFSASEQCGVARLRLRAAAEKKKRNKGKRKKENESATSDGGAPFELPSWLFASGLDACSESRDEAEKGGGGGFLYSPPENRIDLTVVRSPFSVEVSAAGPSSSPRSSSSSSSFSSASSSLFNTTGHRLVFKRRYVEITTSLTPGSSLFGLGERSGSFRVERGGGGGKRSAPPPPLAIWARDTPSWKEGGENLYGAWPAWIEVVPSSVDRGGRGRAHGAVLLSSAPVEAQVSEGSLSLRVLLPPGSTLEIALLPGPTPADVSDQMTRLLGRPALPPSFALGTHQSR